MLWKIVLAGSIAFLLLLCLYLSRCEKLEEPCQDCIILRA